MEFLSDYLQPVMVIVGAVVSLFGIAIPFLKPKTTRKVGNAIGTILVGLRQDHPKKVKRFRRIATTAYELLQGILEKLPALKLHN